MSETNWMQMMKDAGAEGGFKPLPEGEYDVVIKETEAKKTANGKDMIFAKMQVIAGPHANRIVFNNFTISPESPKAMNYFFQHMSILGLDENYFTANPSVAQVAAAIIGKPCRVSLDIKKHNNQDKNNVTKLVASTGVAPAVAAPTVAAAPVVTAPVVAAPAPVAAEPAPAPVVAPPVVAVPQPATAAPEVPF